jgi:hypothetical protein
MLKRASKFTVFFLLSFTLSFELFGYIQTRGSFGKKIQWASSVSNVVTYANLANNDGINVNTLFNNILLTSAAEWSSNSNISISPINTSTANLDTRNDIFFSTSSSYFSGNNVLAITQVSFRESNGEIIEADIILNDNVTFVDTEAAADIPNGKYFLGSILTHELGHSLGMGHSEVKNASMFFNLIRGQDTLTADDIAGIHTIYPTTTKGTITGSVIGGNDLTGIFGAHVQAISTNTGKVQGATISDNGGSFEIGGLDVDDTYYIYIEPAEVVSALPNYYSSIRKDFCTSGRYYRGSFNQSCENQDQGFPKGVSLTSGSKSADVGQITIRCELEVPADYLNNKGVAYSLDIVDGNGVAGDALVGFFTNSQVVAQSEDLYQIDLSNYNVPAGDLYLDVKVVSQSLYSMVKLDLEVTFPDFTTQSVSTGVLGSTLQFNSDGNPDVEILARIPLNTGLDNDNDFSIKLTPELVTNTFGAGSANAGFGVEDFFPAFSSFVDDLNFYFIIFSVSQKVGASYFPISAKDYSTQGDNAQCPDAPETYATYSVVSEGSPFIVEEQTNKAKFIACGTIDMGGNNMSGPGPGMFIVSFLFVIIFSRARSHLDIKIS